VVGRGVWGIEWVRAYLDAVLWAGAGMRLRGRMADVRSVKERSVPDWVGRGEGLLRKEYHSPAVDLTYNCSPDDTPRRTV
jgi:hypothetical protein